MRRRRYLAFLGTAITGGLAGCAGSDGGAGTNEDGTEAPPGTATSESPATTTGTQTGTPTETSRTETTTATDTTTDSTTEEPTNTQSSADRPTETTATPTSETTDGTTTGDMDGSSEGTRTVEVGPGGRYVFVPGTDEPLEITTGTTVEWVWRSDLHNVVVDSQPADASWEGTPGGAGKTYNTGYTYTHTFEIPGEYHYWCEPHRSLGMDADVVVTGP